MIEVDVSLLKMGVIKITWSNGSDVHNQFLLASFLLFQKLAKSHILLSQRFKWIFLLLKFSFLLLGLHPYIFNHF